MKLITKAMNSPVGLRVTFEATSVAKFHVNATLPDPNDRYRVDVKITMPEDRREKWKSGVVSAFRRMQNGKRFAILLDYANAIRFFTLDELFQIDKKNEEFSLRLYGIPEETLDVMNKPKITVVSKSQFSKMYTNQSRNKKERREDTRQ